VLKFCPSTRPSFDKLRTPFGRFRALLRAIFAKRKTSPDHISQERLCCEGMWPFDATGFAGLAQGQFLLRKNWLPVQKTQHTIASASLDIPVYSVFHGTKIAIKVGNPPVIVEKDERLTKALIKERTPAIRKQSPLIEAMRYEEMLNEPSIVTKVQIGDRFGASRARISQVMSLLDLDESIKDYLFSIKNVVEHNFFTERKLRPIALTKDKDEQKTIFRKLLNDMRFDLI